MRKTAAVALAALLLAPVAAGQDLMTALRGSIPPLGGEASCAGLGAEVTIERDAWGVPVIRAGSFEDAIRAQGFLHAQERFFQMDLARRLAAGRLAEILGPSMLGNDRLHRRYRFGNVADAVVDRIPDAHRAVLEVYAEGVAAGLAALPAPPPEYALLGVAPEAWAPRDTVLVMLAMFEMLNWGAEVELRTGVAAEALDPELLDFLGTMRGRFEVPLLPPGAAESERAAGPVPIPGPEVVDLRRRDAAAPAGLVEPAALAIGSNNWAVAGTRTADGRAIVANDPHLQLSAPGVWYRAQLEWGDRRLAGLSFPGAPGITIGSNGRVAWGFTNTTADFQDLVVVERAPDDPMSYRVPEGGTEPFGFVTESIAVKGAAPVAMTLQTTRWGVVTGEDHHQRPVVLKWTALDPESVDLGLFDLVDATTLEEAIDAAQRWRGPSQNCLVADDTGRIGWTVTGWLPRRVGFDGSIPASWAEPGVGWEGQLEAARRPTLLDPPDGLLYTANNRTVALRWARLLGRGWDLGARAQRIGELLRGHEGAFDEGDLLAIQLDVRLEVLDFYRDLALEATESAAAGTVRARARGIVLAWDGTASVDQPAVRLLDAYRHALQDVVIGPLVEPCRALDPGFTMRGVVFEEPARRILETRPDHLLPPGRDGWSSMLADVLESVAGSLVQRTPERGLDVPWGDANRARIAHPLTMAAPQFASMLGMPDDPLAGHVLAVRVATPRFGASARMVVSPGAEDRGILHVPAGQSGHPLSLHFRSSHASWLAGEPTPFLAAAPTSRLVLKP